MDPALPDPTASDPPDLPEIDVGDAQDLIDRSVDVDPPAGVDEVVEAHPAPDLLTDPDPVIPDPESFDHDVDPRVDVPAPEPLGGADPGPAGIDPVAHDVDPVGDHGPGQAGPYHDDVLNNLPELPAVDDLAPVEAGLSDAGDISLGADPLDGTSGPDALSGAGLDADPDGAEGDVDLGGTDVLFSEMGDRMNPFAPAEGNAWIATTLLAAVAGGAVAKLILRDLNGSKWFGARQAAAQLEHHGVDARLEHGDVEELAKWVGIRQEQVLLAVRMAGSEPTVYAVSSVDLDREMIVLEEPGPLGMRLDVPMDAFVRSWEDTANESLVSQRDGRTVRVLPVTLDESALSAPRL